MGHTTPKLERFLLLQVADSRERGEHIEAMPELEQLVATFGGQVLLKETQYRQHPDPSTYIGSGKVEWLKKNVEAHEIDVVVLNDVAKSSQLFRLEKELWEVFKNIEVWDKVDLILHIFEQHAKTTEAKLQIELAKIQHGGPRIYGLGGTVLSRQGGGIGTRGLGETNIEIERRHMKKRTQQIKKELQKRAKQQKNRIAKRGTQGVFTTALVGYTSAGKTTLFNELTNKEKQTDAGLFTTLDSIVGKVKFARTPPVLVSDTIGFIEDLPPQLVKAFSSTLQESMQAKVLLHILDASDPRLATKLEVVEDILQELDISEPPILVFNKIDLLTTQQQAKLQQKYQDREHFLVSAKTGEGIPKLKYFLKQGSAQESSEHDTF